MYSLRGAVVAMIFFAAAGVYSAVDRNTNYAAAKGTVYLIDRKCNMTETTTDEDGRTTARAMTDDCNSVDEWETVREKRSKLVSGKAVVQVSYTAPQNGSAQIGTLEFTGRDDEFYELNAGDPIDILVSKDDPSKIIKA